MNDDLYRLVYVSNNEIEGDLDEVSAEIDRLLVMARERNRAVGVTGALMFNADCFSQVLEGPRSGVEAVFERIQVDLRHSAVNVLDFRPVAERAFANWSMAYVGQPSDASRRFADLARATGFDPAGLDGDHVLDLVRRHLAEVESRVR